MSRVWMYGSYRSCAAAVVTLWVFVTGVCVAFALIDPHADLKHPAVTVSARCSVGMWFGACIAMLRVRPGDWSGPTPRIRIIRLCWTLGVAMHLVHVGFAFGLAHEWSHEAAVRHVAATGGFGWGIAVNYAFAAIWLADAAWWWANPDGYSGRPRWAGHAVHGFLAFVVFNATVVFGPAAWRFVDGLLFGVLGVIWGRVSRG